MFASADSSLAAAAREATQKEICRLCSCISGFRGGIPLEAVSAQHLKAISASLDNSPAIPSGLAAQVYLLASLQRLVTAIPQARFHLVSAYIVPKLVFLAGLGFHPHAQTDVLSAAAGQQHYSVSIHIPACKMLTGMSLGLLSQLVMTNAAVDAVVMQQASASPLRMCIYSIAIPAQAMTLVSNVSSQATACFYLLCHSLAHTRQRHQNCSCMQQNKPAPMPHALLPVSMAPSLCLAAAWGVVQLQSCTAPMPHMSFLVNSSASCVITCQHAIPCFRQLLAVVTAAKLYSISASHVIADK